MDVYKAIVTSMSKEELDKELDSLRRINYSNYKREIKEKIRLVLERIDKLEK